MPNSTADYDFDWQHIYFDGSGKPYVLSYNGRNQSYIPPITAWEISQRFPDRSIADRLAAYASSHGVSQANPSGDIPGSSFFNGRGEFNDKTGDYEQHFAGKGYAQLKGDLADATIEFLGPIQQRVREITDDQLNEILEQGRQKASRIAHTTLTEVFERTGITGVKRRG